MLKLTCPMEGCSTLELSDDIDPVEMAAKMCDHLQRDGCYGESLIERLTDVQIVGGAVYHGDMLRHIDVPLIAEGGGRRHAVRAGWVSLDGRGPALCNDSHTVKIVQSVTGGTLRATARKEPGTVQPKCVSCQRELHHRAWTEDLGRR